MGTDSHTPETPLEYRVRWGNVLLAGVALCGVLAALFVPSAPDAAPVVESTSPVPRKTGPTSLVAQIESPRRKSRRARRPAPDRERRRKRSGRAKAERRAKTELRVPAGRLTPPQEPAATPRPAAPNDPVASEFGL